MKEGEVTVAGMLNSLKSISCLFCNGWGHRAKKCQSLRNMNKMVEPAPVLRAVWGKEKAKYIGKTIDLSVKKGLLGRKRLRKQLEKGLTDDETYFQ